MILKDNDCGVAKDNIARGAGLAPALRHVDPVVYNSLLRLATRIDQPETKKFFLRNLMFTPTDYRGFRKNLLELTDLFKRECRSGYLKLDLNLDAHFSSRTPVTASCNLDTQ